MKATITILLFLFVFRDCRSQKLDSAKVMQLLQGEWVQLGSVYDINRDSMLVYRSYGAGIPERYKLKIERSTPDDLENGWHGNKTGFDLIQYKGSQIVDNDEIISIDSNSFVLMYEGDVGGEPYRRIHK